MILCDTGPLVAAFSGADRDHSPCVRFLQENRSRLVVPSLAVTEVCHLLADPQRRGNPGLAAEFCAAIAADELRVIEATPHDYGRLAELLTTYASLRLQVVDACVIALAKRLGARAHWWPASVGDSPSEATAEAEGALRVFGLRVTARMWGLDPSAEFPAVTIACLTSAGAGASFWFARRSPVPFRCRLDASARRGSRTAPRSAARLGRTGRWGFGGCG